MPRRRQRYSKLFEKLRAQGGTAPTGTDSEVTGFYDYLLGKSGSKIKQDNAIPGEARQRYKIALIPFGLSATTNDVVNRNIAYISAYSLKAVLGTRVNATKADLGIFSSDQGGEDNPSYYPALLRASYSRSGATTNPSKTSAVTGQTYSYTPTRTFSLPFGRTTQATDAKTKTAETNLAEVDEIDVAKSVIDKLKAATNEDDRPKSVSYDPEIFKLASAGEADTTDALTDNAIGTFDIG